MAALALDEGGAESRLSAVWDGLARPRRTKEGSMVRRSKASLLKTLWRTGRRGLS